MSPGETEAIQVLELAGNIVIIQEGYGGSYCQILGVDLRCPRDNKQALHHPVIDNTYIFIFSSVSQLTVLVTRSHKGVQFLNN